MMRAAPRPVPPPVAAPQPARRIASALIVEDHPLFCDALAITLQMLGGFTSLRTATSIEACVEELRRGPAPDVVLLDLNLPDADGLDGLMRVRRAAGEAAVLIVSSLTDPAIVSAALELGAAGYVPKHSQRHVFQTALQHVAEGRVYLPEGFMPAAAPARRAERQAIDRLAELTPQQARILGYLCDGLLNKQIAYELSIAEATVKAHVTVIMRKLDVQSRTQAVLVAQAARFDWLGARTDPKAAASDRRD